MGFVACVFSFTQISGALGRASLVLRISCFDPTNLDPSWPNSSPEAHLYHYPFDVGLACKTEKIPFLNKTHPISADPHFLLLLEFFFPTSFLFFFHLLANSQGSSCMLFGPSLGAWLPSPSSSRHSSSNSSPSSLYLPHW